MDGLPTDTQGSHAGRRDDDEIFLKFLSDDLD